MPWYDKGVPMRYTVGLGVCRQEAELGLCLGRGTKPGWGSRRPMCVSPVSRLRTRWPRYLSSHPPAWRLAWEWHAGVPWEPATEPGYCIVARGEAGAACWDLKLGAPAVVALPSPIGRACPEATGIILGLTFEMGCTSGMYLLASGNLWLGESAHIAPLRILLLLLRTPSVYQTW